ncbi:MAG: AI-2E family transporter [Gammaproteobacteria bacterium]|nr:AI-2E family transporter [Gammaproteobacteria bacterium]
MNSIGNWLRKGLSDPQMVLLGVVLLTISAIIYFTGRILAPVFGAVIIAYLLQSIMQRLENLRVPRVFAVAIVGLGFLTLLLILFLGLIPVLVAQLSELVQKAPAIVSKLQQQLLDLPVRYPQYFTESQISEFVSRMGSEFIGLGQKAISFSLTSVVGLVTVVVYLILVPMMVVFMIRDRDLLVGWVASFLPRERQVTTDVWAEVNVSISNYVDGKVLEIIIIGVSSFLIFSFLGLEYAVLLGALTGFSVLIPFIGAAVVTLPVVLLAFMQWGLEPSFYYVVIAYMVIQALDGNLLAPLLFSEAVDLHPVAIIVAVLLFGGLWGFWGVFFAIPLATVVKAVLRAWRLRNPEPADEPQADDDTARVEILADSEGPES